MEVPCERVKIIYASVKDRGKWGPGCPHHYIFQNHHGLRGSWWIGWRVKFQWN